jgi:hypothetical protein
MANQTTTRPLNHTETTMNRLSPLLAAVTLAVLCSPLMAQEPAKPKPKAKSTAKATKKINWDRVSASVDTHDPAYIEAATAAIRETMERNFQASSAEDLKALMATMTSNCPDRENFQKECKKMFEDTDVYIRLVDCRWITSWQDSRGLWAAVEIKQWTVPKDDNVEYSEYRHRSGLLPQWELCEYQLFARVEKGQWKAHVINGNVFEAQWPEDEKKPER